MGVVLLLVLLALQAFAGEWWGRGAGGRPDGAQAPRGAAPLPLLSWPAGSGFWAVSRLSHPAFPRSSLLLAGCSADALTSGSYRLRLPGRLACASQGAVAARCRCGAEQPPSRTCMPIAPCGMPPKADPAAVLFQTMHFLISCCL